MSKSIPAKRLLSLVASLALCAGGIMAVLPSPTTAEETEPMIYQDSSGKYTFAERAADLVSRMTLQEKASQLGDSAAAIPRLGVNAYRYWSEGLHGVARSGYATSFPTGYGIAQTWNRELVQEMMTITSDEARAYNNEIGKGLSYWSPTINMSRDPRWGRAEETYGEDPYLTTQIGDSFVKGLEGTDEDTDYLKAIATIKHYALNNTERFRHNGSSDIDDATLREYYTRAYKGIVRDTGIHSLMTSYNEINGTPAAANVYTLDTLLRRTFGFTGYVTSDCGAINDVYTNHKWVPAGWDHSVDAAEAAALCITAGNDLECGGVFKANAVAAVQRGLMTEDDIDVALVRMFTARMETGEFDADEQVPYRDATNEKYAWDDSYGLAGTGLATGAPALTSTDYAKSVALQSSEEAVALLKNEPVEGETAPLLPLDGSKINKLVVVGENNQVNNLILGDYSGTPLPENKSTPLQGITQVLQSINPQATVETVASTGGGGFYGNLGNLTLKDASGKTLTTLTPNDAVDTDMTVQNSGANFGYVYNQSYAAFKDVSVDDVTQITLMASGNTTHGTVNIHMDSKGGPIIGSVDTKRTAGWDDFVACTGTFDANSKGFTGTHDLYLVCDTDEEYKAFTATQEATIKNADAVIAYVGTQQGDSGEEHDRSSINFPRFQSRMVQNVLELNPRTAVYVCSVSQMNLEDFREQAPAILWCTYNGQAQGEAAGNLLFGKANPSGKLTFTWYSDLAELGAITDYTIQATEDSHGRTYQYFDGKVSYPFGHGLSYSTFDYQNLRLTAGKLPGDVDGNGQVQASDALLALKAATKAIQLDDAEALRANVDGQEGVSVIDALMILQTAAGKITLPTSEDTVTPNDTVKVSVDVTNTSAVDGQEVVQAYVTSPKAAGADRPVKQLKGFEKVAIKAGETKTVTIELPVEEWYFWDEQAGKNVYDQGDWTIGVGSSSGDIRESATVTMDGELTLKPAVVAAIPSGHTLDLSNKTITTKLSVALNDDSFMDVEDANVVYTSSDESVATVDADGTVHSVAPGVATITATATVNGVSASGSFPVAVKDEIAVHMITINGKNIEGFQSSVYRYDVIMMDGATSAVVAVPDGGDYITIQQPTTIPGTATVTANLGDQTVTYTINIRTYHEPVATDFTAIDSLPDIWKVYDNNANMKENPAGWKLTDQGLVITTEAGDLYQNHNDSQNIFLQAADGDWIAETKFTMSKGFQGGYQQVGFLVFQDEDNYIKFSYESGGFVKVVQEVGGTSVEKQTSGLKSSGETQYFRILRSGDEYAFYYSTDGESYTLAGSTKVVFKTVSLGLTAVDSFNPVNSSIDVAFAYVHISEMSDCTCTVEDVLFADRPVGLQDAKVGYPLAADVEVGGDCQIPGHDASNASYQFALTENGENTAGATISGNILKATQTGYVDVTTTVTLPSGATAQKTARITVKDVQPTSVETLVADVTSAAENHTLKVAQTLVTPIDTSQYDTPLYLDFEVKVDSTHQNPAPANDDWVKYIVNGWVKLDNVECAKLGYNADPHSFTKAGEWTKIRVAVPAAVLADQQITGFEFLTYNDTGTKYVNDEKYVNNGIQWSNDKGAILSVRNVTLSTTIFSD